MATELITVVEENSPENRYAQEEGTTTKEGIGAAEEGIIVVMWESMVWVFVESIAGKNTK